MNAIYNLLYLFLCIVLAYVPYKPNQKKLFIGTSIWYAIFVGVWFCVFIFGLMYPVARSMRLDHDFDWLVPFITIIWFSSPFIVRKFGKEPNVVISDKPARLLIRFDPKMFLTKYFEILFQQSMFLYILFVLLGNLPYWTTVTWFVVLIGIIHLGNFPFTGKKDTLFYFYLSLPMAVLFGMLILCGFVSVTIAIHMVFYLIFNGRHWFLLLK